MLLVVRSDQFSPILRLDAWQLSLVLFLLMLICIWLGSVVGKKKLKHIGYEENPANSTIFGSVFGLLAFLLAFTFSMSGSRYEARRQAYIKEANDIGTAILRADLYPESERIAFRSDFKNYLRARIDNITAGPDINKVNAADKRASIYSVRLWSRATGYSKRVSSIVPSGQMIPALNAMFDSANSNMYSELLHVPQSIVLMLFVLAWMSSFFVGYISVTKGKFDWFIGAGFCFLSALVIFITLDLDRPRRGFIQLDTSQQAIITVMEQFEK